MKKFFLLLAATFTFSFFTNAQTFQLNGSAVQVSPRCFRLTDTSTYNEAASVYSTSQLNLNNAFDISFFLNFGCKDVNGGDGITFILQNSPSGATALGGSGGGMGFANGPTISPSLAVEFDCFDNTNSPGWPDVPADHIDIIKNGDMLTNMAGPVQMSVASTNVEDCNCHIGRVQWNPSLQRIRVYFDGSLRLTYFNNIITNYFSGNPNVYWGFGSGTGVYTNIQTVSVDFADAGTNQTICAGSSTTLNGTGGTTYSWSPSTGLSSSTIANPIASPTVNTTYTLTATNSTGCSDTSVIKILIVPNPTANAGSDVSICPGSSASLNGSGTGISFSWIPTLGISNSSSATTTASPTNTTTYSLITTSANGCTATDDLVVTVLPNASADAGILQAACSGGTVQLNGSGGVSYSWSPSTGLSNSTISNPIATVNSNLTYTLIVVNASGCSGTDTVSVHTLAAPITNAGNDLQLCKGSSVQLSASGGIQYSWSPYTGLSSTVVSNPICFAMNSTTYTVTATNASGCTASDDIVVTVNIPGPAPTLNPLSPTICAGSSVTINASGCVTYSWFPSTGLSSTFGPTVVASPTATTNYTCAGTDANGCVSSRFFTVTVTNAPTISSSNITDAICPGSGAIDISLTGTASYQWSNGATTEDVSGLDAGTYTVTVSSSACVVPFNFTVGQQVLPKPQNVLVNNITACSARLNWNAAAGMNYYTVRYKETSSGTWSVPVNAGAVSYYDFSGLNPSANYYFSVEANCAGGSTGGWVNKQATTKVCSQPLNVSVNNISSTSAVISWSQVCSPLGYELRYRKTGATAWTLVSTTQTSATLNNLIASTTYQFRLRANCSGGYSTYTPIQTFTTLVPKLEETKTENQLSVFPNPNSGTFTVVLPVSASEKNILEVVNVLGEKIFSEEISKEKHSEEIQLDTKTSQGIYFVVFRDEENILIQKIIVQ